MSTISPQAQTAMAPGLWASTKTNITTFASSAWQGIKTVTVRFFAALAYYGSVAKDQMVVWGQALKACVKANPTQFQYLGIGVLVSALIGVAIYCCVCRGTQPQAPAAPAQQPQAPAQAASQVPTTPTPQAQMAVAGQQVAQQAQQERKN